MSPEVQNSGISGYTKGLESSKNLKIRIYLPFKTSNIFLNKARILALSWLQKASNLFNSWQKCTDKVGFWSLGVSWGFIFRLIIITLLTYSLEITQRNQTMFSLAMGNISQIALKTKAHDLLRMSKQNNYSLYWESKTDLHLFYDPKKQICRNRSAAVSLNDEE